MTQQNKGCRFPYTMSAKTLTVLVDGNPHMTDRSNPNWSRIVTLLNDPNATADALLRLLQPITGIADAVLVNKTTKQQVTIKGGAVFWGNESVHNALTKRILDIVAEGLPVDPWLRFMENVYANPFPAAKIELFEFLEKCNLPITADGCFIAYKLVRSDYKDIYSGTVDNSVGKIVEMDRSKVDGDRRNLCSTGLHFCSQEYLPHYGIGNGSRVVLVKINPADVVSIPLDYNLSKGRCARYQVIGETTRDKALTATWRPVVQDTNWDNPDADDTLPEMNDEAEFWKTFIRDAEDLNYRVTSWVTVGAPNVYTKFEKLQREYEVLDQAFTEATDKKTAKDAKTLLTKIKQGLDRLELAVNNPLPKVEQEVDALHNRMVTAYQHETDQATLNKRGVEAHGQLERLLKNFEEARRNPLNTQQDLERVRDKIVKATRFLMFNLFGMDDVKTAKINATPLKPKAPEKKVTPKAPGTLFFLYDGSGSTSMEIIRLERQIGFLLDKRHPNVRWFQFAGPKEFQEITGANTKTNFLFGGGTDHGAALERLALAFAKSGDKIVMVTDSDLTATGRSFYDLQATLNGVDLRVLVIGSGATNWERFSNNVGVADISKPAKSMADFLYPQPKKASAKKAAAQKAAPAKKAQAKAAPKVDKRPGFDTKIGRLTKTRWNALLKEHKTLAGIAKHYGISQGTLQGYKKRLFG